MKTLVLGFVLGAAFHFVLNSIWRWRRARAERDHRFSAGVAHGRRLERQALARHRNPNIGIVPNPRFTGRN